MSERVVYKRAALHRRHVKLGARMREIQGWMVPASYTNVEDEVNTALRSVGICDVSHYGKVDVKGNDIDGFLERNFAARDVPRKPGEVRASVSLLHPPPDGTGPGAVVVYACRLTREHALLITEPSRASSVLSVEGLSSGDETYLTNLSSILAGFTIAGPASERVLRKLVEVDLSAGGARGPFCLEAGLAKVHSTIIRSEDGSSAGVPTFDVCCGRDYSEYVWDALMEAGREFGMAPFGLDAHERLRGAKSPQ